MDLAALVADRPLLAQLSAEYEALKRRAAGEPIDYSSWIRERLRAAAAKVVAARAGGHGGCGGAPGALDGVQRLRAAACAQQRLAYRTRLRQQQRVAAAAAALAEEDSAGGAVPGAGGWQARCALGGRGMAAAPVRPARSNSQD
ncbi:hypothetical protein Rsub_01500 [Raphidocelis subcapitata]|uniref:Uncharacterized protein n=1 Tax=Raphidocelis subcapitata TaxID=307507 RepID=A0A2V0NN68_9CHLO|nr:hypothetical protein Rsub_01500 [Raphidocelis subcapitata]|eukprot:GBF89001.1 hypothetical protein Rsub_01500 [Raphidocelis subcapitata]